MEAFSAAGKVLDAKLPTDRETGRPRGFAFVEFEDDESAEKSIQLLNGKDLRGRPIRVNEADNRPPRPGGPGGGGGGGGGGFGAPRSFGGPRPPSFSPGPDPGFNMFDDRGRPMKNKGSRRNIRRRKRGFD